MKQIFLGLTTLQYQTTWKEIFRYREMHIGMSDCHFHLIAPDSIAKEINFNLQALRNKQ